jgi:2-oxoisovalerate dehydrogenase E2 component (dihydrolipoyl transacylase)
MPTTTITDVTMPRLGESVTEGTIGTWLHEIGDRIEKYDPLVEVESDKASSELPSPIAGTLVEILVEPGETVPVGTPLCRIEEGGAAISHAIANGHAPTHTPGEPALARTGGIADEATLLHARSSPVVRRLAEEHGIDITQITGSGLDGRVTKRDVLEHIASLEATARDTLSGPVERVAITPDAARERLTVLPGDEIVPLTAMRRAIAATMVQSALTSPQATVVMEVDMSAAVAWRTAHKDAFRQREGIDLTYLPILLLAVTQALRAHPRLNAAWDEDRIIHRRDMHLGVAVALEDGLVVPVIRHADRLSLTGLAHAVADLAARSRDGSLNADELTGGTFTVNNPGTFGSLVSTPILVPSQVGILSMEAIVKRPVVVHDMIGIRSMMNLSLSIDHRAVDGLGATRFLQSVRNWLEHADSHLPEVGTTTHS